jgi:hypothetical protein
MATGVRSETMPTYRPVGGLLLELGTVGLALGIRLGLLQYAQRVGREERVAAMLAMLVLTLLWVVCGLCLASEGARPDTGPAGACSLVRIPGHLREDWRGDVTEACGQYQQAGWATWAIRVWVLLWFLQLVEARVRYACYKVVWAHRWKKP